MDKSIKEFISGKNCRRIALDKEMDEIDGRTNRIGCEIGEERYNICKGNPWGTKRGRVVVENQGATPNKRSSQLWNDGTRLIRLNWPYKGMLRN